MFDQEIYLFKEISGTYILSTFIHFNEQRQTLSRSSTLASCTGGSVGRVSCIPNASGKVAATKLTNKSYQIR